MAQPISFIPSQPKAAGAEHAEAIDSALDLLQLLHDRGVLDLLRGLVGAGDQVVDILTTALNTPEAIRGIRNFLLLTKFFATIPPEVLSGLVQTATEGAEREKSNEAPGLLHLLRRMNSENSRHALAVMLDLMEGVGKGL
jgi:uncharacterized protein YjgD (DUF1641 family)